MPTDPPTAPETQLIAGPPPANPPLPVALLIVLLSLIAPVLFVRTGHPSLWLTSAVLALAFAGVLAFVSAVTAQTRRYADREVRARATITAAGITFLPTHARPAGRHFPRQEVKQVHLLNGALIVLTNDRNPAPGRHVLRFGKLASSREQLLQAIQALMSAT